MTLSIRFTNTNEHDGVDAQHQRVWVFQRALFASRGNIRSFEVEEKDQSNTLMMIHAVSSKRTSWDGIKDEVLLRNKTRRLQRTLNDIQQKLRKMQHLQDSQIMLQKPSKELAVVKMPAAPMVYENNDFLLCGRSTLKILILVMTDHNDKLERTQFRKHWRQIKYKYARDNNLELKWKMVFVVGRDHEESAQDVYYINEAIFQRDMLNIHARSTQTIGTIFGALHWAHNGCSYRNILVIRPNMGLNAPVLYKMLHEMDKKRKDYFMYDTLPAASFQKSQQPHQQTNELDILYQNSAWIVTRGALEKVLPLMRMYTGSNLPINYHLIWRYMKMLKFERLQDNRFVSNFKCKYQVEYALNILPSSMCLRIISNELNSDIGTKSLKIV